MARSDRSRLQVGDPVSEGGAVLIGIGLLFVGWMMDEQWVITHFPPDYFPPYSWIESSIEGARVLLAIAGTSTIFLLRRPMARALKSAARRSSCVPIGMIVVAVILALAVAELVIHSSGWQSVNLGEIQREPLRVHDPVLGWTLTPSHTGYLVTGGRRIEYANDAFGYRQPHQSAAPDFARPTIILAGESVLGGFGLHWDESVAGLLNRLTNTQTVDLSVGGYATDQIYLRLKRELPRFQRPVAVVILFSPMLFRRNADDGRPHLGPDLALRPAVRRSKLGEMTRWAIPYRSVDETDRAIATTRAILASAVSIAKSRGATPIVLVPQFVPENSAERLVRSRVLANIDLPVVSVSLDGSWHLPGDWHPDARAARAMALAIAGHLQRFQEPAAQSRSLSILLPHDDSGSPSASPASNAR